ncbi:hypothetical protein KI387_014416 [Taxus chinensis]|uniref:Acyl carrier protein n=1 Tax=Taxus chinensis TaxID=29808 RepID=A0AA38CQM4_TAXCH|nr:hypothetical protein KI387_014416 [Taxus chinensis]
MVIEGSKISKQAVGKYKDEVMFGVVIKFLYARLLTLRITNATPLPYEVTDEQVGPSAHFEKDLSLDMLDTVEIMMEMEEEFAIDIPNSEADKMTSCADVIKYVTGHPQAK